jgi:hypothetical protein
MHGIYDFKRRLEKRRKRRKTILFLNLGVFISLLFCTGVIIWEKTPKTKKQRPRQQEKTTMPSAPAAAAGPGEQTVKIENYVKNGDTIINILKREGVDHRSAYQFFTRIKPVYNLKKICAGNKYTIFLTKEENEIKRFIYEIDPDYYLEAWQDETTNGCKGKTVKIPYRVKRQFISGVIRESLFESILEAGEKPELADMMASLYEFDIDFNRDVRKRDSFALLVEKLYLKGKFIRYGHVLAAQFTNRGKTIRVIRYSDPDGETAYYHPDGKIGKKDVFKVPASLYAGNLQVWQPASSIVEFFCPSLRCGPGSTGGNPNSGHGFRYYQTKRIPILQGTICYHQAQQSICQSLLPSQPVRQRNRTGNKSGTRPNHWLCGTQRLGHRSPSPLRVTKERTLYGSPGLTIPGQRPGEEGLS